jgi:hypothetical protein
MEHESGTENTVPKLLDQAEFKISLNSKTANLN